MHIVAHSILCDLQNLVFRLSLVQSMRFGSVCVALQPMYAFLFCTYQQKFNRTARIVIHVTIMSCKPGSLIQSFRCNLCICHALLPEYLHVPSVDLPSFVMWDQDDFGTIRINQY